MEYVDDFQNAYSKIVLNERIVRGEGKQKLFFEWKLPRRYTTCFPLDLELSIRYGKKNIKTLVYKINTCSGYIEYFVSEEEKKDFLGIASYKLSLKYQEKEIASRIHHLWTEVITIPDF